MNCRAIFGRPYGTGGFLFNPSPGNELRGREMLTMFQIRCHIDMDRGKDEG